MLLYLESRGVGISVSELLAKCFFMSVGGSQSKVVTELGSELSSINVGKKQTNGRYLGLLKQRLIDLLQVHNATESEIDSVYQHIIMEVLPKTNK